jgi:hypothetical protein
VPKYIPSRKKLAHFVSLLKRFARACGECFSREQFWESDLDYHAAGLEVVALRAQIDLFLYSLVFFAPYGWPPQVRRALAELRFGRAVECLAARSEGPLPGGHSRGEFVDCDPRAAISRLVRAIAALEAVVKPGGAPSELRRSPRWDSDRRSLWYGETVCRDFGKRNAPAQIKIIEAFVAAKWKSPIVAPYTEKTLRDNICNLNKGLESGSPIKFAPHGPSQMAWRLR